jgi:hypothetical protein
MCPLGDEIHSSSPTRAIALHPGFVLTASD